MRSRFLQIAALLVLTGTLSPLQAHAAEESTPTVDEIIASYTNTSHTYRSPRSGDKITLHFKPDGVLGMDVDDGVNLTFRTWKWWVTDDSRFCTHTSVGERCDGTVKVDNTIYRILKSGNRVTPVAAK